MREKIQGRGAGHRVGDVITVLHRRGKGWHRHIGANPQPATIIERYVTVNDCYRNPAYRVRLQDGREVSTQ